LDFSSAQLSEEESFGLLGIHGIELDSSLEYGCSNKTPTYNNPRLTQNPSGNFTVSNMEVWTLTPCYTEEAAIKMEQRKLFVQTDGTSFMSNSISNVNDYSVSGNALGQ